MCRREDLVISMAWHIFENRGNEWVKVSLVWRLRRTVPQSGAAVPLPCPDGPFSAEQLLRRSRARHGSNFQASGLEDLVVNRHCHILLAV